MNPDDWIIVPNWDRFQHYKHRAPRWIKVYSEVAIRGDVLGLTDAEFGLLVRIWVLFGLQNGHVKVRDVVKRYSKSANVRPLKSRLERLNHAGFIQISASTVFLQSREEREKRDKSFQQEPVEDTWSPAEAPLEGGLGEQLVGEFRRAVEARWRNGRH